MLRRPFLPLLALALVSLVAGCGADAKKAVVTKSIEDRFAVKVGERVVQLQIAVFPAEMQKGLMYRKSMPENEGMIFVYDRPEVMSFWMRNTEIPLDIGFFDEDGTLREIYPLYPHDERSVGSRGRRQFALEMNQGWFSRNGVKAESKLDLKAVADAVRARGLKPERFGLK